jgi:hypothetical protein
METNIETTSAPSVDVPRRVRRTIVNYNTCPSCGGPGTRYPEEQYCHCPNGSCDVKLFRNRINGAAGELVSVWQGRHKGKRGVVIGWTNTLRPQTIIRLADGKDIEADHAEIELVIEVAETAHRQVLSDPPDAEPNNQTLPTEGAAQDL